MCTTIAVMAQSEVPRRVKSYSAATGYVYQVSVDRKSSFLLVIFVAQDAVRGWARRAGRALSGTEEYAAAKMRLFQLFDEEENLAAGAAPDIRVDESALFELLSRLDL